MIFNLFVVIVIDNGCKFDLDWITMMKRKICDEEEGVQQQAAGR